MLSRLIRKKGVGSFLFMSAPTVIHSAINGDKFLHHRCPSAYDQQGNYRGKRSANPFGTDSTIHPTAATALGIRRTRSTIPSAPGIPTTPAVPRIPTTAACELKDADPAAEPLHVLSRLITPGQRVTNGNLTGSLHWARGSREVAAPIAARRQSTATGSADSRGKLPRR